jgi:hypothetical protein
LLQARRNGVGVLRAHRIESAKNDEVERAGQDGQSPVVFTWHPSTILTASIAILHLFVK